MSIALELSEVGAIATYTQLVEAIRDRADDEDYSQSAIDQSLRLVEAHLDRELRTPEMERVAPLAWTGELATLPDDFLEMRDLRLSGDCRVPLRQVALGALGWDCSGAEYAISGLSLRFGRAATAGTGDILYYGRIQPLTAAIQSNWVLDKHPDVYLAGALHSLAEREVDEPARDFYLSKFLGIIESIKQVGISARYGGGRLIPQGMGQVRGVRA